MSGGHTFAAYPYELSMLFESAVDLQLAQAISCLAFCNPFLPERIECERKVLGEQFVEVDMVWNLAKDWDGMRPNIGLLRDKTERLAARLRDRLVDGNRPLEKELRLYEDVVAYLLYY